MNFNRLLGATALASVALLPHASFAQTGTIGTAADAVGGTDQCLPDDPRAICQQEPAETVTVTGSRIRTPNLTADVPITSIAGDVIFQNSDQNVGELLNDLPQLRSTFSQQNPGLGIGIAGLNLLDLRGLGTARTLVLVNGRRHVAADILSNASVVDVSSIPNDLVERIDIVTGGSSAVYGSDAIAGVVNFVLRRSYEGSQIRGSASIAGAGFGGSQYISAMTGRNFADGKGNITLHGEYSRQERVFASDVPAFRQQDGLFTVDADTGGLPNGSDGFPDAIFLRDVRSGTINPYGLIPINQRNAAGGACGNATAANNGAPNNSGLAFELQLSLYARRASGPTDRHAVRHGHQRQPYRGQRPDRPRRPHAVGSARTAALQLQPAVAFRVQPGIRGILRRQVQPQRSHRQQCRAVVHSDGFGQPGQYWRFPRTSAPRQPVPECDGPHDTLEPHPQLGLQPEPDGAVPCRRQPYRRRPGGNRSRHLSFHPGQEPAGRRPA
ncbi:TonB-dependent receptor plug domain-containing protein [Sphingomonas hankookensis]|uniref:TonB-dependent receptor plug domain-containing protein n=1 Tax=Sphingomonas hankookensis TaxID=563996 RepID=UPI003F794124